ncbi:MAG: hypothetical protein HC918_11465 [Oscillatoriales cyanobacterium SM2_1_8]|nr:hypothetical protein [Oscillatoriales cyanobacterium SM2_1_8]
MRNGYNENSLRDVRALPEVLQSQQGFVDPYHPQVRADWQTLVAAIAQRRPDGLAIDYIRYPNRTDPWIRDVRDMPIYGATSYQALQRRTTPQGFDLLYRFLASGRVPSPNLPVGTPLWRLPGHSQPTRFRDRATLTNQLWQLAIAHARQGIVEFLNAIGEPARAANIPISAVFFPWGDRQEGNRVDPRLQPWSEFRQVQEWAPMAYANCNGTACLRAEIGRTVARAPQSLRVCPVLAGAWNRRLGDRPPWKPNCMTCTKAFRPWTASAILYTPGWMGPTMGGAGVADCPEPGGAESAIPSRFLIFPHPLTLSPKPGEGEKRNPRPEVFA